MIEFLQDYTTEALPPEHFRKGEQVTRSEESERYFVGRGLAGYLLDGKLVDIDHRPVVTAAVAVEIVQPGDRRIDLAVRAGEIMTGQPPRASSGPGVPFVEPVTGAEGSPPVVLQAEVERLKAALATSDDLFRDMNNSHVEAADKLRGEIEQLTTQRAQAVAEYEKLQGDHADLQGRHDTLTNDHSALSDRATADAARIAELERQLEAASKPADKSANKTNAK